jgi:putative membrane protein
MDKITPKTSFGQWFSPINLRLFEDKVKTMKLDYYTKFLIQSDSFKNKATISYPKLRFCQTPFYTVLALWVGATLVCASLRVGVEDPGHLYRSYQLYLGRLLTFLTIGIVQAAIVTIGDLYLLHTYVEDKLWFVF